MKVFPKTKTPLPIPKAPLKHQHPGKAALKLDITKLPCRTRRGLLGFVSDLVQNALFALLKQTALRGQQSGIQQQHQLQKKECED